MKELLALRKFVNVHQRHICELIKANQIDASEVQAIMDETRISNQGYRSLYKCISQKGKARKLCSLPKPKWVNSKRHEVNSEALNKLGTPFHINGLFSSKGREIEFNEYNNIFFDLTKKKNNIFT